MKSGIEAWWESHCNQCGLCCYEKIQQEDGSWLIDLSSPCPWLDIETRLCTVYEKRFRVNPRCLRVNLPRALFTGYLSPSCAYVRKFRPSFFPSPRIALSETVEDNDPATDEESSGQQ